jgi:hypothetical protein
MEDKMILQDENASSHMVTVIESATVYNFCHDQDR